MIVNGALGGLQSFSTGGSWSDITFSTGIGLIAGWLGGDGPKWADENVFLPRTTAPNSGVTFIHSTSTRFWHSFKTIWKGLDSDLYVTTQFSGLAAGVFKGMVFSNIPTYLPGIMKHLWEKYYPDTEENECNERKR